MPEEINAHRRSMLFLQGNDADKTSLKNERFYFIIRLHRFIYYQADEAELKMKKG